MSTNQLVLLFEKLEALENRLDQYEQQIIRILKKEVSEFSKNVQLPVENSLIAQIAKGDNPRAEVKPRASQAEFRNYLLNTLSLLEGTGDYLNNGTLERSNPRPPKEHRPWEKFKKD